MTHESQIGLFDASRVLDRVQSVPRTASSDQRIIAKQKPRPELEVESLADIFAPFAEFDMLNREDKRQLLNTISPTIIAANYQIKGLWIGIERADNVNRRDADSNIGSRYWLEIGALAA